MTTRVSVVEELTSRLAKAEACYARNSREADKWRTATGIDNERGRKLLVQMYVKRAHAAWARVDSLRYKLSVELRQATVSACVVGALAHTMNAEEPRT